MPPAAVRFRLPVPTEEVPSTKAEPFTSETALLPELLNDTAPVKAFPALLKAIAFAPALKLEVPPTVRAPDCAMPAPTAVKFVPMFEVAKFKARVFVIVDEVPLLKATLPVKLLAEPLVVKLIEVPAFKVVVPGTVTVPVWLMASPAVKTKLPPFVKVTEGRTIVAVGLLKFSVKLRKFVSEVKFVGTEAAT